MKHGLKIRKSTWHYRLVSFMYDNGLWDKSHRLYKVKNLCMYGRRVIFAVLLFLPLCVLLAPGFIISSFSKKRGKSWSDQKSNGWVGDLAFWDLAALASYFWIGSLYHFVDPFKAEEMHILMRIVYGLGAFVGIVDLIIIAVISLAGVIYFFKESKASKNFREAVRDGGRSVGYSIQSAFAEDSFLGIACQWIWAQKMKICPKVEFVNE